MIYLLDTLICFCLIIFQSVILPMIPWLSGFYDLMVPFIIYLAVFRSIRSSLIFLFFLGFVMDGLSGSPIGLYITAYLWLLLSMRGITKIVHLGTNMLWPSLLVAGVFIENLIFYGIIILLGEGFRFSLDILRKVAIQMIWAGLTGPFLLILIHAAHGKWEVWSKVFFRENKSARLGKTNSR